MQSLSTTSYTTPDRPKTGPRSPTPPSRLSSRHDGTTICSSCKSVSGVVQSGDIQSAREALELLYVRKTFYPRQTSGNHIIRHLFDLIARQDSPEASPNVVRCYGAYFPEVENDGVRGIFEFCEGGSLHSISNVITQRGGIVGEKVAGRIASGV
jgi:hypothetical protein